MVQNIVLSPGAPSFLALPHLRGFTGASCDDSNHSGNDPVAICCLLIGCWILLHNVQTPEIPQNPSTFAVPGWAQLLRLTWEPQVLLTSLMKAPWPFHFTTRCCCRLKSLYIASFALIFPWSSETGKSCSDCLQLWVCPFAAQTFLHTGSQKVVWLPGPCTSSGGCKLSPAEMVQLKQCNSRRPILASEWIVVPSRAWKHDTDWYWPICADQTWTSWNEETIVWREETLWFSRKKHYLPQPLLSNKCWLHH